MAEPNANVFAGTLGRAGAVLLDRLAETGRLWHLAVAVGRETVLGPFQGRRFRLRETCGQIVRSGNRSLPLVALIAALIGTILALQSAYQLRQLGAVHLVADLVAISVTRELAPLMTAILVAGRAGSAIAAELGTMKVSEEIDALTVIGLDPIGYLVVPRILGLLVAVPCLTLFADLIGVLGGLLIGVTVLDIGAGAYIADTIAVLVMEDLWGGVLKAFVFGGIIGLVACQQGLGTRGGADAVGRSTTTTVVRSIVLIIGADLFVTALLYLEAVVAADVIPHAVNDAPVIEVRGIRKAYDGNTVLDGVDLVVDRGETVVILGGSGSGKSTLLRCMLGLEEPDEGTVSIQGTDVFSATPRRLGELRQRVGVAFQSGALFGSMTVGQNIDLLISEFTDLPASTRRIIVDIKLALVGLEGAVDRLPAQLSGGMKKRAAFARAMALDPDILLCDEPSAGLDPVTAAGLDRLLIQLKRVFGITMVVVTHELESAFAVADRIALIHNGRFLVTGTPERVRQCTDPVVRRFLERQPEEVDDRHERFRQFMLNSEEAPDG